MTTPVVRIEGLQKSYRQPGFSSTPVNAVKGINLEIKSGEIWAMAGPNGAGKTTTLHCLLGLLIPDAGDVQVFGQNPRLAPMRQLLGFQSEIFFSYAYRHAEDALRFYGRLSGLRQPLLDERVHEALAKLDLLSVAHQRLGSFSKGMMQRVGLAQSLMHHPDLIIWDEPSTGLDPEGRRVVTDLLKEFKAQGKTVLLSTHILSDIEKVCDHLVIINQGRTLLSGEIQALLQNRPGRSLEDLYLDTVKGVSDAL